MHEKPHSSLSSDALKGALLRLGLDMVVRVAMGMGFGFVADQWGGWAPWGLIVGFFFGLASAGRHIYQTVQKAFPRSSPPSADPEQRSGKKID